MPACAGMTAPVARYTHAMPPDSPTSSRTRPSRARTDADLDGRLAVLGAESDARRTVKGLVPWVASFTLHGLLIGAGFLITWTVVARLQEEEPPLLVADFYANEYQPLTTTAVTNDAAPAAPQPVAPPVTTASRQELERDIATSLAPRGEAAAAADPLRALARAADRQAAATGAGAFAPQTSGQASFVGLRTTNARKIVYVIDASGSMIRMLPVVVDELAKSLQGLSPRQSFAVVFFQRNEALLVPPGRLVAAAGKARATALDWIRDHVIPGGRSNPIEAIRAALAMEPDAIFLLSENITGSGEFEIDQRDLLALLDRHNPRDARSQRRRTQINCIQFLSPDPLDTLRKIAEAHGGPNGYKFLDRAELGYGGRQE
jgi:von Willebrand factor type A domain